MNMKKIPDWILKDPIAHRGLHSGDERIPENSLSAFKEAALKGFPIELDIHLLKDKQVVVFHDDDLNRVCGVDIEISTLTSSELQAHRLFTSGEKIPLLKEVLEVVDGRVPLLIELKDSKLNKGIHEPLMTLLNAYEGKFAIQSFDPSLVEWFVLNEPHILRGQLSGSYEDDELDAALKHAYRNYNFNHLSKPDFIAHEVEDLAQNAQILKFKAREIPILAWTVRSHMQAKEASAFCDNIIFEGFLP
jgi:glycerophosphoryl diester phosphodiesterase